MHKFSDEDGQRAVRAARAVVESLVIGQELPPLDLPGSFDEKGGVFVTLKTYPDRELRGCIGYPEPVAPLAEALVDSAISAASRDPRFHPVRQNELSSVVLEVSLLTPPEVIDVRDPAELLDEVVVGEDGLIVERSWARGLLLPQVPVEWSWGAEEFLEHVCRKAGLPPSAWRDPETRLYRFRAEVFSEETPRGKISREVLSGRDGRRR